MLCTVLYATIFILYQEEGHEGAVDPPATALILCANVSRYVEAVI